MKIAACLLALTAAVATAMPQAHHARFLAEKEQIAAELQAWKESPVGIAAREKGFYKPSISLFETDGNEQELLTFFQTKLDVEEAQKMNPLATFSTNNLFALMTNDEFKAYVRKSGYRGRAAVDVEVVEEVDEETEEISTLSSGTKVDWTTDSHCVSPIQDQGYCGSCWAFSATAASESAYCQKSGKFVKLAEQQVVSCDIDNQFGCEGGYPENAIKYIGKHPMAREEDFPYVSYNGTTNGTCTIDYTSPRLVNTGIKGQKKVGKTDRDLRRAIKTRPTEVGVAAGGKVWANYVSGIVSACDTTELDHAVVAVGYDVESHVHSYKLKNQWSTEWGSQGYIYVQADAKVKGGVCGVLSDSHYPII